MTSQSDYLPRAGLSISRPLVEFLEDDVLPRTGVDMSRFWDGFSGMIEELAPRNRDLLVRRADLQALIDNWHCERVGQRLDAVAYREFLTEIGYLLEEGSAFAVDTENVDAEIAVVAGPQLVVPVSNARYAINAANARWGSLYDALYGTDALGSPKPPGGYDPVRGAAVVAWTRSFLDDVLPVANGSHVAATRYLVADGRLVIEQSDGNPAELVDAAAFAGYTGEPDAPLSVLLTQHGLGIELVIDPTTRIGRDDLAGISDVVIESALTTIVDFEDSVAAVDVVDKVANYRNWLGLMTGELSAEVAKGGPTFTRRLNPDRTITAPDGSVRTLPARALLLTRNVGHLMTTSAVLDAQGDEVPEGLVDAMITVLIAMTDPGPGQPGANSRTGSIYVVKPKMHGPDEVAFADLTLTRVEQVLGLPANTVKVGIMDEERRTTINLAECIRAARSRVAFINTGFLDRTGDEIHTSMQAGPMIRKPDMKRAVWISAYEDWNVDVGLACGLRGRAQIGKGMWAAPDLMADMLADKIAQPRAGASCAWVPSPTAATLHATHYHRIDVGARQSAIASAGRRATLADLLTIPVAADPGWSPDDIQGELENNAQGILGYVVRWIDQGIGCSKVPDIHGTNLMEDRATCRISSQHIANWLYHGVVSLDQVDAALQKMARIVDAQNAADPAYTAMSFDGHAFQAARDLVVHGAVQPSGYTEPILHSHRKAFKHDSITSSP